ncbi:transglutaminase family protein [Pseudomonas sp. FP1154]|jgi:transglutaminase-like putative cysteine protease|uniref:Transglutaminase family protein n=1 Tax=Pseudomonas rhizophila TaxID=2045200 RepID=A0ABM6U9N1_9PSED|nr:MULTISPECIES: transglutaminase family protein [Pseudomonas]AVU74072.1 transglutaminase family protein [Pseudomonas rhizophila]MDD2031956.1 transglutaminase family protein [Pseudomonas sp. 39167]MEA1028937.1 transglutaminase family protein [Pseudomonas sp. N-137]MXR32347.1 transglutaminase family protein [Pseudomonas sp. PICF6]QKJ38046.1 transglutaminase family protein [Pseudomonas sp. MPDS]
MSARYQIFHDTHYHYDSPVSLAQQLAHLWPRPCEWQRCTEQQLLISPEPTTRRDELDVFGNPLTRLAFERPHDELLVNARLSVEVLARPVLDFSLSPAWESTRHALTYSGRPMAAPLLDACRYRFESPYVHLKRSFVEFSESCFAPGRPLMLGVRALMEKIFEEFTFDAEATQVATPLVEVLERRRGVCQDFAHLMLACVRSRGLAARYVSGYLLTQPPPGQPRLIGADASHAWISVFCPVLGWVDFDPTNNVQPALEHITLAWGRDFSDVSPLRGVILGGGDHDPEVRVTVMPLES